MEQINKNAIDTLGLTEAFQNWISTVVDTINGNNALIQTAVGSGLLLTNADSSAPASVEISNSFKDWLKELVETIETLQEKVKVLEGR